MRHYVNYGNYGSNWGYGAPAEAASVTTTKRMIDLCETDDPTEWRICRVENAQVTNTNAVDASAVAGGGSFRRLATNVIHAAAGESEKPLGENQALLKQFPGGLTPGSWLKKVPKVTAGSVNPHLGPGFTALRKIVRDFGAPKTEEALRKAAMWYYTNVEVPAQAAAPAPPPPTPYAPPEMEALVPKPRRKGRTGPRKGRRKGKRKGKKKGAESWWAKNWWVPVAGIGGLALVAVLMAQAKKKKGGSKARKSLSISTP